MRTAISFISVLGPILGAIAYFADCAPRASAPLPESAAQHASNDSQDQATTELDNAILPDGYCQLGSGFVTLESGLAHVFDMGCGSFRPFSTPAVTITGYGNTPAEAEADALAKLGKKLWPAAYGCGECSVPKGCQPGIAYPIDSMPKPEVFPDIAHPYMAIVSYSGEYLAVCSKCQ